MPEKQVIIEKPVTTTIVNDKDVVKEMINDKYYSVYFDFNKSISIIKSDIMMFLCPDQLLCKR